MDNQAPCLAYKALTDEVIQSVIGKKCWYVAVGGVTLPSFRLVLGKYVKRPKPLDNTNVSLVYREHRGGVEILVWCAWRLDSNCQVISGDTDESATIVRELEQLVGTSVTSVAVLSPGFDMTLEFDNGRTLRVFCNQFPENGVKGNWELWLPDRGLCVSLPGAAHVHQRLGTGKGESN